MLGYDFTLWKYQEGFNELSNANSNDLKWFELNAYDGIKSMNWCCEWIILSKSKIPLAWPNEGGLDI